MEKGKGQGRSCLARRLLVRGCSPLDLANTAPYSFRYRDIFFFSLFPGIFWGICSHAALLGGQLCDNTTEKAALSCNMLWSQRPYEVVMSFTRSKPGPRAVRKIGRRAVPPTLPYHL
ncbi:hypothetical protein KY284_008843 [Solanum tuberosum]|nr:hypothetical protein KY284_008843 [Solanum tuberosum]